VHPELFYPIDEINGKPKQSFIRTALEHTPMNSTFRVRRLILLVYLFLVCKSLVCLAFTTPTTPSITSYHGHDKRCFGSQSFTSYVSTVDYDQYESTGLPVEPSNVAPEPSSLQSRTLSPNFLINSSILIVAIITILYQVLSVDLGITRGWNAEEIATRIPLDNWRSYNNVLNMAPLQTKAVTSATVYTIGDMIAQNKEGKDMGDLDRGRVMRSLLAGLIGHGPMSHVWYHVSEDFFDGVLVGHHWWDFIPKVVVDQVCLGTRMILFHLYLNCHLCSFK